MTTQVTQTRGATGRRVTLQQRRVLLERLRAEVARVVEDVEATAATLRVVAEEQRPRTPAETVALRLLEDEQRKNQLELERLYWEYEGLAFRAAPRSARSPQAA